MFFNFKKCCLSLSYINLYLINFNPFPNGEDKIFFCTTEPNFPTEFTAPGSLCPEFPLVTARSFIMEVVRAPAPAGNTPEGKESQISYSLPCQ